MTLQDLNPGELLRYATACRELIKSYQGDIKSLESCPLCPVADSVQNRLPFSSCDLCLWQIIEYKSCLDYTMISGKDTADFPISTVRMNPKVYPEDASRCIERLAKWITLLEAELLTRE